MNPGAPVQIAVKGRSCNVGPSVFTAALMAAVPKCPLRAMALMGALGVGSIIGSTWLQPLSVALLLLSVGALFVRTRRLRIYGPLYVGLAASTAIYLCKFTFGYDTGVYLGGAALPGASVWNALPKRRSTNDSRCRCQPRAGAPGGCSVTRHRERGRNNVSKAAAL